ncbi:hypothetical protein CCR91_14805 [Thiorhodovibrio winogradskyi]|nr:hypothetical protein [Thiorhodovibrio winogradskyi]
MPTDGFGSAVQTEKEERYMSVSIKANTIFASAIAKSWKDSAYRERLLADSKTVLREEGIHLGDETEVIALADTDLIQHVVLPVDMNDAHPDKDRLIGLLESRFPLSEGQQIRVLQNSQKRRYLVVPMAPATAVGGELSDDELDRVAGGGDASSSSSTEVVTDQSESVTVVLDACAVVTCEFEEQIQVVTVVEVAATVSGT